MALNRLVSGMNRRGAPVWYMGVGLGGVMVGVRWCNGGGLGGSDSVWCYSERLAILLSRAEWDSVLLCGQVTVCIFMVCVMMEEVLVLKIAFYARWQHCHKMAS